MADKTKNNERRPEIKTSAQMIQLLGGVRSGWCLFSRQVDHRRRCGKIKKAFRLINYIRFSFIAFSGLCARLCAVIVPKSRLTVNDSSGGWQSFGGAKL